MARAVQTRTLDVQRRILDAAVEVLLEQGYGGATTVQIQERAGVSRGPLTPLVRTAVAPVCAGFAPHLP